nr:PaeR7I family type II restriction endonuclease [Micromonospora sp. DSM 115978]
MAELVAEDFLAAGFRATSVRRRAGIWPAGCDRPAKTWDILIIEDEYLVAAVDIDTADGQRGDTAVSTRIDAAVGNAVQVWNAYRSGALGSVRPWLGYVLVADEASYLSHHTSYALRQRLLRARCYDAVCLLTSPLTATATAKVDPELSYASLKSKIAGCAAEIRALRSTGRVRR